MNNYVRIEGTLAGPFPEMPDAEAIKSSLSDTYPDLVYANSRIVLEDDKKIMEFYTKAGTLGNK